MDYKEYFCYRSHEETLALQKFLSSKVILEDRFPYPIKYIGGVDTSFSHKRLLSVIIVCDFESLKICDISYSFTNETFPYVPGFLSFREGPSIIEAWKKLNIKPDILIFDGQGIAHPRGLGIASHVGVVLDMPSIGCAKKPLVGNYKEPGEKRGDSEPIYCNNEVIGVAIRTKDKVKPVFVSSGHRVSLESAINIILKVTLNFRLPEPTRLAHIYSKRGWSDFKEEG